jgi:conjugative relaxase-like TrwC/TraI family protein
MALRITMLSILKTSIGSADYYLNLAREDYYLNGGEPPGQWHGKGAELMGLVGQVQAEHFQNLFAGFSPSGKVAFVQNAGQRSGYHKRVPGWDLTFSVPKSVSVCWALASADERRAIERAFEESVRTALSMMEGFAGYSRRGVGGRIREKVGFCYAMFQHGTSRAQDPQLHYHVVCFNVGIREDRTTGALWTKALYEFKKAVGHLQRCELATLLRRDLQWPIEQVESWFEVKGVSPELIDRFSTRRKEVLARCEAVGDYGAVAAEAAARSTRRAKEHVSREQLFPQWREVGKEFGWTEKEVTQLSGGATRFAGPKNELGLLAEAVRLAMGKHQGTLTRAEVLEAVASVTQDSGLSARQIAAAVYSAAPKFRKTDGVKNERQLVEFADAIKAGRKEAREQLRSINDAQRRMIHLEARLKKAFEATQKKAEARAKGWIPAEDESPEGKAKDAAWKKFKEELRQARERAQKSKDQKKAGDKAQTSQTKRPFASFRIRKETPQQAGPRWAIDLRFFRLEVRDVRAFRNAPDWSPIAKLKLPGLVVTPNRDPLGLKRRLILPLDRTRTRMERQIRETLAAVLATGVKRILFRDDRFNSTKWNASEWGLGDKRLRRSQIVIAKTDLEAFRGLINDWTGKAMKYPEDNVILTQTRKRADVLNKAAQKRRQKGGHIAKTGTLVGGTIVHQNDRIIFRRGKRSYGVEPDDLGTVTKINSIQIRVALDSGKTVTIPTGSCPTVDLAYAVTHRDARKSRSRFAHVLFEGNDSAQELAAIVKQRSKTPVRIYVASEHTKFFTAEGHAQMRDQYRTEEETQRAEQEKLRAAREAEEKRRKEDDLRREEEKRRRAQAQANSQSNSQSHGHSH